LKQYSILRLLFAGFLLYIAWPAIPEMTTNSEVLFWGIWLAFFLLFVGGNSASLFQLVRPPSMEKQRKREH